MATATPPTNHRRGDSKDTKDFFEELKDIEQGADNTDDEDFDSKTPDEGEQELEWLHEAGLTNLASQIQAGKELKEEVVQSETTSLTRAQAEAVRKRVATLNATLRKKQNKHTDIRDVFPDGNQDINEQVEPPSSPTGQAVLRPNRKPSEKRRKDLIPRHSRYDMCGDNSIGVDNDHGVEIVSIQSGSVHRVANTPRTGDLDNGSSTPSSQSSSVENLDEVVSENLGKTHINDLGVSDLEKLKILALLELTSLFDSHSIVPSRQKPRKRYKESGVFGVPLQSLLDCDQKKFPDLKVPRFFLRLIQFLEREGVQEEGILRVPGSVQRIKQLRQDIDDKFNSDKFSWEDIRPNDAAGLLKQFLRDLPVPLLTFEYLDSFVKVEELKEKDLQLTAMSLLVLLLPAVHRNTLRRLLQFLKKVVEQQDNKMTMINVCMIIAPNLFLVSPRSRKKAKSDRTPELEMRLATSTASIVRIMLENIDTIWTVDPRMLEQVRHKYEMEEQKKAAKETRSLMRFMRPKDKLDNKKKLKENNTDYQKGLIRVQAPHLMEAPVPFELQPVTTAGDIVADFHRRTLEHNTLIVNGRRHSDGDDLENEAKSSPRIRAKHKKQKSPVLQPYSKDQLDRLYLAEVGGNIGERRLDRKANMLALLHVNPKADWVIRVPRDRSLSI